ncbi:hypothetical protein C1H46_010568 [Malus baccata]|uniref:Uncharacterized protein n=1 Tax=Malus baccata TaxID=106549 RepID=A0A540MY94_MALBA|nr:hypothetical protein C1H46_010568 [Malus baccata]
MLPHSFFFSFIFGSLDFSSPLPSPSEYLLHLDGDDEKHNRPIISSEQLNDLGALRNISRCSRIIFHLCNLGLDEAEGRASVARRPTHGSSLYAWNSNEQRILADVDR